jgi:cyclopropane-fatty-acyl-phospholipid synthase
MMLLRRIFQNMIRDGSLVMIGPDGTQTRFGCPAPGMDDVVIRLSGPAQTAKLLFAPALWLGEAYMNGNLCLEQGTIYDLLALCARNLDNFEADAVVRFGYAVDRLGRYVQQHNPVRRARRNVAHHYDLSGRLYDLFLDRDRQYSCAYFARPDMTLEEAQLAKKRHLAAKLLLQPGQRVLDIGCGWGGLGLYLAQAAGVDVTGITLSTEQIAVANQRAAEAGRNRQVRFHLRDYRDEVGQYHRIVSVGMFEHVGQPHYLTFFRKLRDLLADDGVAVLHAIGQMDGPIGTQNPWLRKYIFPGGYTPALSEVLTAIEKTGLWVTDIEILRLHYAETLHCWRERFLANRDEVAGLYDERFCRMWEFYLSLCEVGFRWRGSMVFQIQLTKRIDAVPIVRGYMVDWERGAPDLWNTSS